MAITAFKEESIIGIVGARGINNKMWELAIWVNSEHKCQGLASTLISKLTRYVLQKGVLPFYGTAESHIQSQKVAIRAGLIPFWAELYTKKMDESSMIEL